MHPTAYQARLARIGADRAAARSPGRAAVGSTLIPGVTTTVGDRERVLDQLHTDFVGLQADIFAAAGWRADHPVADERSPIWQWWERDARPTVEEWQAFYADQAGSWWAKFSTDWSTYTDWQKRLLQLRELARGKLAQAGHRLESPDPVGIPKTPWESLGDQTQRVTDDVAGILKIVAVGALAVGGVVVVSSIAGAARRGG